MRARILAFVITLVMINPLSQGLAQEIQIFRIGTGGASGTYYPIGGMIASAISNPSATPGCADGGSCAPPGLVVIAQSSNGSVANIRGMQRGQLESGFVQSDVASWAYNGTGTFKGEAPVRELRSIANLYPESIHIVTRKDSGIKGVRDLQGKRVSLDESGSGTLIDALLVLNEFGLSADDMEVEYSKPDLAIKRIRDNKLDAFFIVAGYPARAISELAMDTEISILPIDGNEAEQLITRYGFFSRDEIPQDVYLGKKREKTVSVGAQWLVSSEVDAELVYQITRALWSQNSRLLLDAGHVKGRLVTLETALQGIAVPVHPGALRFYQEIGMSIN